MLSDACRKSERREVVIEAHYSRLDVCLVDDEHVPSVFEELERIRYGEVLDG